MLADHGHPEIRAVSAAVSFRDRETQVSCFVGKILHFAKQRFPFVSRQSAIVEIRARPFAAVIEESNVVVGLLDRLDLARDEQVKLIKIGDQVRRQCKIQLSSPWCTYCGFRVAQTFAAVSS